MAWLDMFNPDNHQSLCGQMSPRISFSNDFVDPDHMIKHERATSSAPISSDFEFSRTDYTMITAEEIFFKGRLLPLKENCTTQLQKMTLRDELLHRDGWEDDVSQRPPKAPTRWKELLGLKKTNVSGKKHDKKEGTLETKASKSHVSELVLGQVGRVGQEMVSNGGTKPGDVSIGT
ncbi:putative membrane-associated kinase regulator 1 -like protein [Cinnamomum micranthum f. kanehirae]|uniref:Putative membrane-associated kinase regulator 1-like protein n=1 Tax=Cinnamomum micranthum f. kanehirae TaxID=337451 RepID=A0A443PH41_9MAGN|nr:putative membrane-associated kinase regulator 1 -like protein [Cinnamomum micranthum f. kanehirae]